MPPSTSRFEGATRAQAAQIAALSLAFLCGEQEGDNRMELGRERIKIVCYPHDGKGGPKVASAYIELA